MKKNHNYRDMTLTIRGRYHVGSGMTLFQLTSDVEMPYMHPGQFVNILPPPQAGVLLRRPISICMSYDNKLWLMVKNLGRGSAAISEALPGTSFRILLPLGNGFDTEFSEPKTILLVGGGVGIAPLFYLGKHLRENGHNPTFLFGLRSASDLQMSEFPDEFLSKTSDIPTFLTTEDGSVGTKGLVTSHDIFRQQYDRIYCCGPMPMMRAIAKEAKQRGIECQASLENKMACGIGACLCCVEDTLDKGNVCTCVEGPVFNINELKW